MGNHENKERTSEEVSIDLCLAVLAFLRHAEDLGQRAACVEALQSVHCGGRQDHHAVRAFPAEHFLPRESGHVDLGPVNLHGEGSAGGVVESQAFAGGGDPVQVRHTDTGGGT